METTAFVSISNDIYNKVTHSNLCKPAGEEDEDEQIPEW